MSEQLSSGSRPSLAPRGARWYVVVAILGLLAAWIISVVVQNSAAIAALARSDKHAKAAIREFVDTLCAGDATAAARGAHAAMPREDIDGLAGIMPKFGPVKDLTFSVLHYYDTSEKTMYYSECFARFEHGATRIITRVWKVGDQWKIHDFSIDALPHGVKAPNDDETPAPPTTLPGPLLLQRPPEMLIDVKNQYHAVIETSRGDIAVELFAREAPITVNNFVVLARKKFYDGVSFHRVIADFMIQGGDPTGTGEGGPGYCFQDEVDPQSNPRLFQAGTLAMANSGPNTNGSQFFITNKPTPWLQGKHTVFGQVRDARSQEVVNSIRRGDLIKSIRIEEAGEQ